MTETRLDTRPADAPTGNWVDRWAPAPTRPYFRLARSDRPIGAWLLMWPCWWSAGLAALAAGDAFPNPWFLALFFVGAFVMRGAGCAYNDIVDRDFDAQVERTRARPIPSGQVSVRAAQVMVIALSLVGLAMLVQLNSFAILLGIASLIPVALYPFMKRVTYFPQVVFASAFSWGALMGWAATFGRLDLPALVLYAGSICWNIGYDTIYAHQDKEDDALVGVKSTALKFGEATRIWLVGLYGVAFVGLTVAGLLVGAGPIFLIGMVLAGAHLAWQIVTLDIDDAANCLVRFRGNRDFGAIVFAALVVDMAVRAMA